MVEEDRSSSPAGAGVETAAALTEAAAMVKRAKSLNCMMVVKSRVRMQRKVAPGLKKS